VKKTRKQTVDVARMLLALRPLLAPEGKLLLMEDDW
jgi:hypothetical protein